MIDADGTQVGIIEVDEAKRKADESGLDLVEVAGQANPPVCRIMDYGKFKYEQQKKEAGSRDKQHQVKIKELRLRPTTEDHDLDVKLRNARKFLEKRNKVLFKMRFRGREMAHQTLGYDLLKFISAELEEISSVEMPPKMEGRQMSMLLSPKA